MPETNETKKTYRVPESKIEELRDRLDKLLRKAAKLEVQAFSYSVGASFDVPYLHSFDDVGNRRMSEFKGTAEELVKAEAEGHVSYFRYCPVTVDGVAPAVAGFEFVATLQHLNNEETGETINMLRTVPGFEGSLPTVYRNRDASNCDHCQKRINTRKDTFIVRESETNTFKQVGRNCLADFLGGRDPHAVVAALEGLFRALAEAEEAEGFEGGGSGGAYRWSIREFLTLTATVIRLEGWCSRGKARQDESLKATADTVLYILNPPKPGTQGYSDWKLVAESLKPTDADKETSEKALTYARETLALNSDRSDYEHNLYAATTQSSIDYKLAGITASLIPYYLKEVERQIIREAEARLAGNSTYQGKIGERGNFYVKLMRLSTYEGQFGTTYIHKLMTREGNIMTWFGSNNPGLVPGKEYYVSATVKKQEEYKGIKQTVVSRLSVWTEEGLRLEEEKQAKKAVREAKKAAKQAKLDAERQAAKEAAVEEARHRP